MKIFIPIFVILFLLINTSCYRQNIMFQTDEFEMDKEIAESLKKIESEYVLKPDDIIELKVETNKGEALIDPNFQLRSEFGVNNLNSLENKSGPNYLIRPDGTAKLPMVGNIYLAGFTLYQADSVLRAEYLKFYKDPFVVTQIKNRRVYIFNGEKGMVVPLANENTTLIEALAISGGIGNYSKSHNIRLIRGDLKNPYVEVIDLSTIEGMQIANLELQNQDIVYIEPVRRVVSEATREIAPIINLLTSFVTIIVLLTR
ncbi:MAG: polysaccharide biosynthesis/export family protein [Cytophagales bacterium]